MSGTDGAVEGKKRARRSGRGAPRTVAGLTEVQREIVSAVCAGSSNAEIAAARRRSERTIANQLAAIYRLLGVGSRLELVAHCAREAGNGGAPASSPMSSEPAGASSDDGRRSLSAREREVASWAVLGHSTKVIAHELGLAKSTVASYLAAVIAKLGVGSRVGLIRAFGEGRVPTTMDRAEDE